MLGYFRGLCTSNAKKQISFVLLELASVYVKYIKKNPTDLKGPIRWASLKNGAAKWQLTVVQHISVSMAEPLKGINSVCLLHFTK